MSNFKKKHSAIKENVASCIIIHVASIRNIYGLIDDTCANQYFLVIKSLTKIYKLSDKAVRKAANNLFTIILFCVLTVCVCIYSSSIIQYNVHNVLRGSINISLKCAD